MHGAAHALLTLRTTVALLGVVAALGCSEAATGPRSVPAAVAITAGAAQQGTVGHPLDTALAVVVTDKFGDPVPGVLVHFAAAAGQGSLSPLTTTTGPDGQAQSAWTLPTQGGTYHASATVAGLDSVSFSATAVASQPVTVELVRGDSQAQLVGQRLDSLLEVRVVDGFGNPVRGAAVSFSLPPGQGAVIPSTGATDGLGLARATWILGASAGPLSLTATVDTLPPVTFHAMAYYVTPPATQLALGDEHGCGILPGGAVRCWGVNRAGEVSPSFAIEYLPVDVPGVQARVIAAGNNHSCAIASDDLTYCWGEQSRLGTGGVGPGPAPVGGGHHFVAISAGSSHSCGVEASGAAWCWGWNDHGQLGDGSVGNFPSAPVRVSGTVEFAWVAAGGGFSCGLSRTGALYCWGLNTLGQLLLPPSADVPTPTAAGTSLSFIALEAGSDHACAITYDHKAYCWGSNGGGKLGGGPTPVTEPLVPVYGNRRFRAIAAGGEQSCGLDLGGALYCWGSNQHGAVGGGAEDFSLSPVQVAPGGFATLALGYWSSCAGGTDGSVYCWGDNRVGTLGLGPTGLVLTPTNVVAPAPFQAISVGGNHTCATTSSLVPYCWGANFYGEVGVGYSGHPEALPQTAIAGQSASGLNAGYAQSCALLASGAACWGYGDYLGQGAVQQLNADPVGVPGGGTWIGVFTSWERSCGLAADSTAWCWGYQTAPSEVPGGFRFTQLVVGNAVSCGLQADSTARCWTATNPAAPPSVVASGLVSLATQANGACGLDASGQAICWTPGLIPSALPTALRFIALSGGGAGSTCGVATDGAAYCWGANDFGQLGDGTLTSRATPTAVAGGHTFTTISAGSFHSCALGAAGEAYCWGQNWWGQLGNGSLAQVPVPTKVY